MTALADAQLLKRAASILDRAYCPYSRHAVGAALLTADGAVFPGCNIENASYGLTICAERVAFFSALAAGCRTFAALALVARGASAPRPCGACRQVMAEFCSPDFRIVMARTSRLGIYETRVLGDLLPEAFRFEGCAGRQETKKGWKPCN